MALDRYIGKTGRHFNPSGSRLDALFEDDWAIAGQYPDGETGSPAPISQPGQATGQAPS